MMRPFLRSSAAASSSSVIRCGAIRLIADHPLHCSARHPPERLVAGHAGVVDDDVDAAVGLPQVLGDRRRGIGVGDVDGDVEPPSSADQLDQLLRHRRHVEPDDVRAVAGEHLGDRRADARARRR